MDQIDKKLLSRIQQDFPLVPKPYSCLAQDLGLEEEEVLARLEHLRSQGVIRRLGAIFDSQRLGYHSTLCAFQVSPDRLTEVSAIVNACPGVTHNYLREHPYNMWFTLIAPSARDLEETLARLVEETGVTKALNLPAVRLFKINVNFNLEEGPAGVEQ